MCKGYNGFLDMIPVTFFMLALNEPLRNILMLIFLEHFLPTLYNFFET